MSELQGASKGKKIKKKSNSKSGKQKTEDQTGDVETREKQEQERQRFVVLIGWELLTCPCLFN